MVIPPGIRVNIRYIISTKGTSWKGLRICLFVSLVCWAQLTPCVCRFYSCSWSSRCDIADTEIKIRFVENLKLSKVLYFISGVGQNFAFPAAENSDSLMYALLVHSFFLTPSASSLLHTPQSPLHLPISFITRSPFRYPALPQVSLPPSSFSYPVSFAPSLL